MDAKMLNMPRPRAQEKTGTIRVYHRVARMIEIIVAAEGGSSAEVASPILEKALKARYLAAVAKIGKEPQQLGISKEKDEDD